jgi:hypothetical protein
LRGPTGFWLGKSQTRTPMSNAAPQRGGGEAGRWRPNVKGVGPSTYRELHHALVCLTLMRLQLEDFGRRIARSEKAIGETRRLLDRVRDEGF